MIGQVGIAVATVCVQRGVPEMADQVYSLILKKTVSMSPSGFIRDIDEAIDEIQKGSKP